MIMASSGAQKVHEALADWLEISGPDLGIQYLDEDWDPLQTAAAFGNLDVVRYIVGTNSDPNGGKHLEKALVTPRMTPIHIAARMSHCEIIKLLAVTADVNRQDQHGFTALHYAVVSRNKQAVGVLIEAGALVSIASNEGTTPLDIAQKLAFEEVADILASKQKMEDDPLVPKFREWLVSLGAGEFIFSFLQAGYDMKFISANGLSDKDLDCVGVPMTRLGLRRKLESLHEFANFYAAADEGEDEDEDEDEEDDDEDDDDEDDDEDEDDEEDDED